MNFKVGDVCEVVKTAHMPKDQYRYIGTEVTITGGLGSGTSQLGEPCYLIECADGMKAGALPEALRLKRPPSTYDGNQAGDWDLCPWQPSQVKA
jgi:hypothetical protein